MTVETANPKRVRFFWALLVFFLLMGTYCVGYFFGEMNEKRKWSDFLNKALEEGRYHPESKPAPKGVDPE